MYGNSFLGATFRLVKAQRTRVKAQRTRCTNLHEAVEAFRRPGGLVDMLRGQRGAPCLAATHAAKMGEAAREAEAGAAELRRELAEIQGKIKRYVASFVEERRLGTSTIEGLPRDELPGEVQEEMATRRLLRARHSRDLRNWQASLLRAGNDFGCASGIIEAWADRTKMADLIEVLEGALRAREEPLEAVLDAARAAVVRYNCEQAKSEEAGEEEGGGEEEGAEPRRRAMGASAVQQAGFELEKHEPAEAEAEEDTKEGFDGVGNALDGLDQWEARYLTDKHAGETDAAMRAVKAQLAHEASIDAVLGLEDQGASKQGGGLKAALHSAAAALEREREYQRSDPLAFFPCTALLKAGRQLLAAWQSKRAAFDQLSHAHRALEADLRVNEECLDESGSLSKEKDGVVEELKKARENHKQAVLEMKMLATAQEEGGNADIIAGTLRVMKLPAGTTVKDLRQRVQESHHSLTAKTSQLAIGSVQHHFPETVLYVGAGLPSDLAVLWRPAQTPDSFDSCLLLHSDSRHKVWRVQMGDKAYAIKEYAVGQAGQLQTFLKEAAVIYRHRHPNIVQVKAIFQGSGKQQSKFYLQMPWCVFACCRRCSSSFPLHFPRQHCPKDSTGDICLFGFSCNGEIER